LRSLELAINDYAGRVSQVSIADRIGLSDSSQISRKMRRILDGESTWIETLRLRDAVLLASHDDTLRRAVAEAIMPTVQRADGSRVTADLSTLLAATTASAATEAAALADGQIDAGELRAILASLDRLQAEIDRARRDARARLGSAP
jgi:hypothetical protein